MIPTPFYYYLLKLFPGQAGIPEPGAQKGVNFPWQVQNDTLIGAFQL
jgi:hypothetical protein